MNIKKHPFLSFRRKPESRNTKEFWTPAPARLGGFAGVTPLVTFYERIKL